MVQLEAAISPNINLQYMDNYKAIKEVLYSVYKYLERHLDRKREHILPFLAKRKFILGETQFLNAKQVASGKDQADCPPYLYKLSWDLVLEFPRLMSEVGVRQSFDVEDYVATLLLLKERFEDNFLDDESVNLSVRLASLIDACGNGAKFTLASDIYLPDTRKCLYKSSELCVKDCHWMADEEGVKYVHEKIPPHASINLGVMTRRQETVRKYSEGLPFGQHEKLTTRIKHILKAYPCEKELLKELLQNADDAQATELCFIKDPRQHKDERVFTDSWKPLQGPALCVFNNKPFTEADIAGIQNLGEGSKSDDPNKTGQYGVGFNAVYHLTDAPSFLSKGGEIGEVLCVFDPQCKFVDGATRQEPGRRFKNLDHLRKYFTDVFPCYSLKPFPVENSTMFRFPLRTEEMAKDSNICKTPVTVENLGEMMSKFESEIFDVLLFVNCVRKIMLCEVAENGELANKATYEATATLSDEDARKRTEFADYVTTVGRQLRKKTVSLSDVQLKEVSYVVDLKDNKGCHEKWLVVQRIGFERGVDIPVSLLSAFRAGDLTLLPRGGVAHLLQRTPYSVYTRKPKAFCFLPLPFQTGLPVHINGHFALDHEARRNLWRDEAGGHRSEWNNTLLCHVVAPCYVTLLTRVREYLHLPLGPDGKTLLNCKREGAENRVAGYLCLFPSLHLDDPYWVTLAKEIYRYIDKHSVRLLPVVRSCFVEPIKGEERGDLEIIWLPSSGEGENKAYFDDLERTYPTDLQRTYPTVSTYSGMNLSRVQEPKGKRLKSILLGAGFNLVEAPLYLYQNFRSSNVTVTCITPDAVLKFFKSYSTWQSLSRLPNLPQPVKDTPLKDVNSVLMVLKYCKKDTSFLKSLQGLHLLVTQDEVLRVFDSSSPAFLSGHVEVLPQCASEFVHGSLFNSIFCNVDPKDQRTFKVFDVNAMASRLRHVLSAVRFYNQNCYVKWNPREGLGTLPKNWITQVWKFLCSETKRVREDNELSDPPKRIQVTEKLKPLKEWCLLPATEDNPTEMQSSLGTLCQPTVPLHYLVPIHMAGTVIDFPDESLVCQSIREALRKLGLPELNCKVMDCYPELARMLVASLDKPSEVLQSLRRKFKLTSFMEGAQPEECETILQYFSNLSLSLKPEDASILRLLPFYRTVSEKLINLMDQKVYILEDHILEKGMDAWQRKVNTVFLKESLVLEGLYAFLGIKSLSEIDFYCQFVFEHFDDMEADDRIAHLDRIRKRTLPQAEGVDKAKLLSNLRCLRFLPAEDDSLQVANYFYDPENPVFEEMLSASKFPPNPFSCPSDWLPFLRQIGLVHEVTAHQFEKFAMQVAKQAQDKASERTRIMSEVLLEHLFQRPNVATEGLLEKVRHIPFISPHKAHESLCHVHQQYGMEENDTLPYICFKGAVRSDHENIAWTSANILPMIADPHKYVTFSYREEIIFRLEVLKNPTTELVISHCENVCRKWCEENNNFSRIKTIMRDIYRFLQDHLRDVSKLQQVPCALVEDSRRLILPCQMVTDLTSHQEIRPYLYKIPLEFGEFQRLFMFLGATQVVTTEQYAMVLRNIYSNSERGNIDREEMKRCFTAVKGLFERLEETSFDTFTTGALFLPGTKKDEPDQIFLRKSAELVFDDAAHFRERIIGFDEMLLVDLKRCGLKATNFEVFVNMLPKQFRPRMLTSLVQERLIEPVSEASSQEKAEDLRQLLRSRQFARGVVRLIRHGDHNAKRRTEDGILTAVKRSLSCIRVRGTDVLKTQLLYQGKAIPDSTREKTCFADKVVGGNSEIWNIYLETSGGHEKTWSVVKVAEIVNRITGGLLKDTLMYLSVLLTATPREMRPLLDSFEIREDWSYDVHQPGTRIPIEDHCLLEHAFKDFESGECVGYEMSDQNSVCEEDVPLYIYAEVVEEIKLNSAQTVSCLKKRYKIDVGHGEETIVSSIDLYKLQDESEFSWVAKSLEEAKKEITELIEEAWEFPKETRDKIVKRLYLAWHPEKNPRNEEVFKYLQREIARMESEASSRSAPMVSYRSSFGSWNRHAERQFEDIYPTSPRPDEARRWFRQAEADLKAAANDLKGGDPFFEWACFKCHQAAEKALKAAQYAAHGSKTSYHRLSTNAVGLGNDKLESLASNLDGLLGDSTRMRYPDMTPGQIPNDVYDCEMALKAQEVTESILEEVRRVYFLNF